MSSYWLSDMQKAGVAFCAGGTFFLTLGVIMFFDRSMLAMGNLLFIIGIPLILGPQKTMAFFLRRQKLQGTLAFGVGILLILMRWTFIGFVVEMYGLVVLFGDFLVTIAGYLGAVPVVGPYLQMAIEKVTRGRRNSELPV